MDRHLQIHLDQPRLRDACYRLGIRNPVRVRVEAFGDHGATHGDHHRCRDGSHRIRLNTEMCHRRHHHTRQHLNQTVIHELAHAMQHEREPDMHDRYWDYQSTHGYRDNPYEVEADRVAAALGPHLPVVDRVEIG